jgi:hypothetical protein
MFVHFYVMELYETVMLVYIVDAGLSHFWSRFSASGIHGGPVFFLVVSLLPRQYPSAYTYFDSTMRNLFCTSHSNQVKKNEIGWPFGTYVGEERRLRRRILLKWVLKK